MAVVTRIALQHLHWLHSPMQKSQVICFQLFPSEVSRRFDEVGLTVSYTSRNVTDGHSFISSTSFICKVASQLWLMPP